MVLSDAAMYRVSKEAYIKFEQGYIQKEFIDHLFELFKDYCFMISPGIRIPKHGHRSGLIKSYWFKTFTHVSFTEIWENFYSDRTKTIQPGLIKNYINELGLAYWIIGDGSLGKDGSLILHTQSFSQSENEMISEELNEKFNLSSKVIQHKEKYYVIRIPRSDGLRLRELIIPHMLPSFKSKIPS